MAKNAKCDPKKETCEAIIYDYTNMLASSVGEEHGITASEIEDIAPAAEEAFKIRRDERKAGKLPFMDLPYQTAVADEIAAYAKSIRGKYENLVVLGIGGSALGMTALQSALNPWYYNLQSTPARKTPRLFVEDNADPERIANLFEILDPKTTLVNVISKSGGTAETMGAFLIAREFFAKKLGAAAVKEHIVATTDARHGSMRKIVDIEGFKSFLVPDGVGGRFSVLSPVGLFPAAMVGIDIHKLLGGAAAMDKRCSSASLKKNPALLGSALQYIADTQKGKSISVMMSYSNALYNVADWYRQLWAESLGKKYSLNGDIVNTGQTPVKALGATDQHSQSQLYNEGPNDKTITFLRVEKFRKDVKIPKAYAKIEEASYLSGHTMGELLNVEQTGTELAYTSNKRPNAVISLPAINECTVGQLLYMLELTTAYSGVLYGINPFDQPGVEESKISTNALMGRAEYAAKRAEIEDYFKKLKRRKI